MVSEERSKENMPFKLSQSTDTGQPSSHLAKIELCLQVCTCMGVDQPVSPSTAYALQAPRRSRVVRATVYKPPRSIVARATDYRVPKRFAADKETVC